VINKEIKTYIYNFLYIFYIEKLFLKKSGKNLFEIFFFEKNLISADIS
jgi:hypothetical protein